MDEEPIVDIRVVNLAKKVVTDLGIELETYAHRIEFRRANGPWQQPNILFEVRDDNAEEASSRTDSEDIGQQVSA